MPFVVDDIAIAWGVEELAALGAAAIAVTWANRKEIAHGVAGAIEAAQDLVTNTSTTIADSFVTISRPPIDLGPIVQRTLDLARPKLLPAPDAAPTAEGQPWYRRVLPIQMSDPKPPARAAPIARLLPFPDATTPSGPPWVPDPEWLSKLTDAWKAVEQNPIARVLGKTFKWLTIGNGVAGATKSIYCSIWDCPASDGQTGPNGEVVQDTDPVMYDFLQLFGVDSPRVRSVLGVWQTLSVATPIARALQSLTFAPALVYAGLAQFAGVDQILEATDVEQQHFDWNLQTNLAAAYAVLTFLNMKYAEWVGNRFGTIPYDEWMATSRAATNPLRRVASLPFEAAESILPPWLAQRILPAQIPTLASVLWFNGGWLALSGLLQVPISLYLEHSDLAQSEWMGFSRRLMTALPSVEPLVMMGYLGSRWPLVFLDNAFFYLTTHLAARHFSAFDGQPYAVDSAIKKIQTVGSTDELCATAREAPFTNKNFLFGPDMSLSTKTWAAVADKVATMPDLANQAACDRYFAAAGVLLDSEDEGDRHAGLGLLVILNQIRYRTDNARLRSELSDRLKGFPLDASKKRALTLIELRAVYDAIENRQYDGPHFRFPPYRG